MTKNDITGDSIKSKVSTQEFRNGYEAIFGKPTKCQHDWVDNREGDKKVCEKCLEVK